MGLGTTGVIIMVMVLGQVVGTGATTAAATTVHVAVRTTTTEAVVDKEDLVGLVVVLVPVAVGVVAVVGVRQPRSVVVAGQTGSAVGGNLGNAKVSSSRIEHWLRDPVPPSSPSPYLFSLPLLAAPPLYLEDFVLVGGSFWGRRRQGQGCHQCGAPSHCLQQCLATGRG